ncbi:MAG: cytochrome c [Phycisphaeraceae bacterium]|nr:cytochrome c [Phycisphaeraceae bacterium]
MTTSLFNLLALAQAQTPVPHDIPLPLPADRGLLVGVLIVMFLVHLLFVNLMLGGTLLTAFFQGRSIFTGSKDDDRLAYEIAKTITVSKSLAVVMAVAPLLAINVIYTVYFYTANALTGYVWISIVPAIIIAFLLLYLHKYTWHYDFMQRHRKLHLSILLIALAILLFIPFVFLTNINLMLFPDKWAQVKGFFSAMFINSNVLPRFLHFFMASLINTGLFMVWYVGRPSMDVANKFTQVTTADLKRRFYRLATVSTLFQFIVGPLVLFTLPSVGLSMGLYVTIGVGVLFALLALMLLSKEINAEDAVIGSYFKPIILLLSVTVLCMGTGRHMFREKALVGHSYDMRKKTAAYVVARDAAYELWLLEQEAGGGGLDGKSLFTAACATCHALDKILAAPALIEVGELYKDNPQGIVDWAKKPGRKRLEFAPMPTMAHIGEERLTAIARYIIEATGHAKPQSPTQDVETKVINSQ